MAATDFLEPDCAGLRQYKCRGDLAPMGGKTTVGPEFSGCFAGIPNQRGNSGPDVVRRCPTIPKCAVSGCPRLWTARFNLSTATLPNEL